MDTGRASIPGLCTCDVPLMYLATPIPPRKTLMLERAPQEDCGNIRGKRTPPIPLTPLYRVGANDMGKSLWPFNNVEQI